MIDRNNITERWLLPIMGAFLSLSNFINWLLVFPRVIGCRDFRRWVGGETLFYQRLQILRLVVCSYLQQNMQKTGWQWLTSRVKTKIWNFEKCRYLNRLHWPLSGSVTVIFIKCFKIEIPLSFYAKNVIQIAS